MTKEKRRKSYEIIEFIDIVLCDIEEVEAAVPLLIIGHGSDESFELVDIEGLGGEHIVIQGIDDLFIQEVEYLVSIEVDVVGAVVLHQLLVGELYLVGQVLPVALHPLLLVNLLIFQIEAHGTDEEPS